MIEAGLFQPGLFEAFVAGLLLITVSELGDKTFFIGVILATQHRRSLVFVGVVAALALMTLISVMMGRVVSLFSPTVVHYAEVALFLAFGLQLLIKGWRMADEPCAEACEEAMETVTQSEQALPKRPTSLAVMLQAFGLTFLAEWGDRTQIATIGLAAAKNPVGIAIGAILGHAICTAIAVIGGKLIAGRLSEKTLTLIGGALFLVFAAIATTKSI
ncbi:MAG: TMEM165/GDT1 family protein [Cyanobacteria bacterium J069]|nr:MAG: TMEM165/GDT1 family protein [Cyanobacteria bacterium J069]